jgi:hypothetical protein
MCTVVAGGAYILMMRGAAIDAFWVGPVVMVFHERTVKIALLAIPDSCAAPILRQVQSPM